MKAAYSILIFCILPFSYTPLQAQEFLPAERYSLGNTISTWNVENHSTYLQNWAISITPSGIFTVGTGGNILFFDGKKWASSEIPNGRVYSISNGIGDTLWVGGRNEMGYFSMQDTRPDGNPLYTSTVQKLPEEFRTFEAVRRIYIRPDSTVVFDASNQIIFLKNGVYTVLHDKEQRIFRSFYTEGDTYVNAEFGLHEYKDGELILVPGGETMAMKGIYGITKTNNGDLLLAVRREGLFRYKEGIFERIENEITRFIQTYDLYGMKRLRDGSLICHSLNGGVLIADKEFNVLAKFDTGNGLSENLVYSVFEDHEGSVWLSHDKYVSKINRSIPVVTYGKEAGLPGIPLNITEVGNSKYIATTEGIFSFAADAASFNRITELEEPFYDILPTENGLIAMGRYFYIISEGSAKRFNQSNSSRKFYRSHVNQDRVLAFSSDKIFEIQIRSGTVEAEEIFDSEGVSILLLAEDKNGNIWVSTNSGTVYKLSFKKGEEKPEVEISAFNLPGTKKELSTTHVMNYKNRLIASFTNRFFVFKEDTESFEPLPEWDAFFEDLENIHISEVDEENVVWMRANRRFMAFRETAEGKLEKVEGILDGLTQNSTTFLKRIDDDLFIGAEDGLLKIDVRFNSLVPQAEAPLIRKMLIRNDSIAVSNFRSLRKMDLLFPVKHQDNEFRFEFALPEYHSPDAVEYQFRLKPFEDWQRWTTESSKDYTNIPEGNYSFEVRSKSSFGKITESSVLNFSISPPWFRTFWAYLLYITTISMLMFTGYRFRKMYHLNRNKVRQRIADDLHDDVSATLSSISMFAEAVERKPEKAGEFLRLIKGSAAEAKENISDIIWAVNPENDDWQRFIDRVCEFTRNSSGSRAIKCDFDCYTTEQKVVNLELKQNLWFIIKEIVTNTMRHSGASNLKMTVHISRSKILIIVKDDGCGFDIENGKKGNGTRNIVRRCELLGAVYTLESNSSGTEWKIESPK